VVIVSEERGEARLSEYGTLSQPIPLPEFKAALLERLQVTPTPETTPGETES